MNSKIFTNNFKRVFISLFFVSILFTGTLVVNNQSAFADKHEKVDVKADKDDADVKADDPAGAKPGLHITLTNPLKSENLEDFVQVVLAVILKFLIPILAILFIYTGFQLVMSGGDKAARKTAKDNFFNLVIGAVLILGAWTFGNVILNTLRETGILN